MVDKINIYTYTTLNLVTAHYLMLPMGLLAHLQVEVLVEVFIHPPDVTYRQQITELLL